MDVGRGSMEASTSRHGSILVSICYPTESFVQPSFPLLIITQSTSSLASTDSFDTPMGAASAISPVVNYHQSASQDPFDVKTFSEDPFAQPSSSDEEKSSRPHSIISDNQVEEEEGYFPHAEGRRGSVVFIPHTYRSVTDPRQEEGHPMDTELSGAAPFQEGYELEATPQPPVFQRTFSAPLPQRVGYLRHPLSPLRDHGSTYNAHPHPRPSFSSLESPTDTEVMTARPTPPALDSSETSVSDKIQTPLEAVSLELADGLQAAIQTLLHLSPPHLLDNAKEQYSGCTVQIPSTSLSALLSSMRGLNYLSANVQSLCDETLPKCEKSAFDLASKRVDFDIGELLQSVADLLGGQAGQAGVDFVLFHGDVGIKHVSVQGDGEGLAYALGHVSHYSTEHLELTTTGGTANLGGLNSWRYYRTRTPSHSSITVNDAQIVLSPHYDRRRPASTLTWRLIHAPSFTWPDSPLSTGWA